MAQGGWSYIVTNKSRGTLYIGVTSDIARRAFEHREGEIEGFTKQHGLKRLVFVERYEDILTAIQRGTRASSDQRAAALPSPCLNYSIPA